MKKVDKPDNKVNNPNEFMTICELAGYLNMKKRTISYLVQSMQIPYYRIGRLVRFKKSEIDEWLEGKKQEPVEIPYHEAGVK